MANQPSHVYPKHLLSALRGYWQTYTLLTAIEMDLFSMIADGKTSTLELAEYLEVNPRGMAALLDGLTGLGLLVRSGSGYALTPESDAYLVRGRASFMGQIQLERTRDGIEDWQRLGEAVKTGVPLEDKDASEKDWKRLVRALRHQGEILASEIAEIIDIENTFKSRCEVLDIGGGSAVFGATLLSRHHKAKCTQIDFPDVNEVGKEVARELKVFDRYIFLDGDYRMLNFGETYYDIVLLCNVAHQESTKELPELFKRIKASLTPEGMFVLLDYIPNEDRSAPEFPLLFNLNMLLHTREGQTWGETDYRAWLTEAGFASVERHDLVGESSILLAEV